MLIILHGSYGNVLCGMKNKHTQQQGGLNLKAHNTGDGKKHASLHPNANEA